MLKLAIGARVMLTTNVDVSDGLSRAEVVTNSDDEVTYVLMITQLVINLSNIAQHTLMLYH